MTDKITKLTINDANKDRFRLVFNNIPSAQIMDDYVDFRDIHQNTKLFTMSVKSTSLPSVSLEGQDRKLHSKTATDSGYGCEFDDLSVSFQVGEDYYLYHLLLMWVFAFSMPEKLGGLVEQNDREALFVPGRLVVLNSNVTDKIAEYKFVDLHPTSLDEMEFDASSDESQEMSCTFAYSYFVPSDNIEVQ